MSSIRDVDPIERASILDILLPQRWATRAITRLAKFERRITGLFGLGATVTDIAGLSQRTNVLGGLEAVILSGSGVAVTPGQLLAYPLAFFGPTAVVPRPATYTFQDPFPGSSPPAPEGDDDDTTLYDNPYLRVLPFTFGAALSVAEWWIVYALRATSTVETETNRVVFNETTGAWDATPLAKVAKAGLTFGIARGPSSAGFPALPSGAVPLGAFWVDSGAVDLSTAMRFDLRTLRTPSNEPNIVGGTWQIQKISGTPCFFGRVWAHHAGEHLEFRSGAPLAMDNIVSPGASFATATSAAPKIAWLYLARAGNGCVPRLKSRGADPLATDATTQTNWFGHGVLVLSPVPPKLGIGPTKAQTAGLWDLQSSAPIPLPSYGTYTFLTPMVFPFSGQTAPTGSAICVGMVVYDGLVGGVPNALEVNVDAQGWMRGLAVSTASNVYLSGNPIAFAVDAGDANNIVFNATRGQVGGYSVPVDGLEARHTGAYSGQRATWADGSSSGNDGSPAQVLLTDRFRVALPHGTAINIPIARAALSSPGSPTGPEGMGITGARFPVGVPLLTLRERLRLLAFVRSRELVLAHAGMVPFVLGIAAVRMRGADDRDLGAAGRVHPLADLARRVTSFRVPDARRPRRAALGGRGARSARPADG